MADNNNIVVLPGVADPSPQEGATTEVVKLLEKFLAQAKKGEIRAFGLAGVRPNRAVFTARSLVQPSYRNDLTAAIGDLFHVTHTEREDDYVEQT